MEMHRLMGTSPVVDRSAIGNSVSPLDLDVLGRHATTASNVEIEIPSTPKVCFTSRRNSPNTDTVSIRALLVPAKTYLHMSTKVPMTTII